MYAMLSTLGPGGWETLREKPDRIREVAAEVEALGLKVHAQYALMGQYDFLNLIEAPDEQAMMAGLCNINSAGNVHSETLRAFTEAEMEAITKKM